VEKLVTAGAGKRIPVYEVRGEFPLAYFKEVAGKKPSVADQTKFSYQLYYFAGEYSEKPQNIDTFGDSLTPLYWEDDTERVYKYLARKKKSGRDFGVGVVEEGQESQVWTNDAILKQKRAMEYTSKVIAQTASKKLKGRNVLTEVDDGQILEHEPNNPISTVQLVPSGGLQQFNEVVQQWFSQFERATSAYSMQRGEVTTKNFRLQNMALQQSSSVFHDLQEELGLFVEEIFMDWIMPFLASQLNAEHILAHEFTVEELREIDNNFATYHANEVVTRAVLSGKVATPDDYEKAKQGATQVIQQTKGQRFLSVPKDYYKKFKASITVSVTDEARNNKAMVLESLTNIMSIYVKNPNIAQDAVLMQLFMKIVELSGSGISPISIVGAVQEQAKAQAEAAKNGGGGGGKVSESINFKDLPPDGQNQLAAQAGIKISAQAAPPPTNAPQGVPPQGQGGPAPKKLSLTASGGR